MATTSTLVPFNVRQATARGRKATKIAARLIAIAADPSNPTDEDWRRASAAAGTTMPSLATKARVRQRLDSLQLVGPWGGDAA